MMRCTQRSPPLSRIVARVGEYEDRKLSSSSLSKVLETCFFYGENKINIRETLALSRAEG